MSILLVDAGNSYLKWALYQNGQIQTAESFEYQWSSLVSQIARNWQSFLTKPDSIPTGIILANVAGERVTNALEEWKDEYWVKASEIKNTGELTIKNIVAQSNAYGVKNAYQQPDLLGADRWAGLVGAHHLVSGDVCVIDCGTALTIDVIKADGEHSGGTISPGWEMMGKSLIMNTDGIRGVIKSDGEEVSSVLGKNTRQAIQAGIGAACTGSIMHVVRRYQNETQRKLHCVITGGDANKLLPLLSRDLPAKELQHEPDWVLKGLAIMSDEIESGEDVIT